MSDLGQNEEAVKFYDQATKIKHDYEKAYLNKGAALMNLGKFEEGIKCCNHIIKINPDCVEAYLNMSYAF